MYMHARAQVNLTPLFNNVTNKCIVPSTPCHDVGNVCGECARALARISLNLPVHVHAQFTLLVLRISFAPPFARLQGTAVKSLMQQRARSWKLFFTSRT